MDVVETGSEGDAAGVRASWMRRGAGRSEWAPAPRSIGCFRGVQARSSSAHVCRGQLLREKNDGGRRWRVARLEVQGLRVRLWSRAVVACDDAAPSRCRCQSAVPAIWLLKMRSRDAALAFPPGAGGLGAGRSRDHLSSAGESVCPRRRAAPAQAASGSTRPLWDRSMTMRPAGS